MPEIRVIEGSLNPGQAQFAVVASRFNELVVNALVDGAVGALRRHGVPPSAITVVWVPGAFEIPLAARRLAASGRYQGIVAVGAVIRGATPHFDYVAGQCTGGLATVMNEFSVPIGFGVLTVDTIEQAIERAGTKAGNKGAEAALAVLETADVLRQLDHAP